MGSRSIIITCMGTRGDIQPSCAMGQELARRGWQVTVAAPLEFQEFVCGAFEGLSFADIGISIMKEVMATPEGAALRRTGPLRAMAAARAFFNERLLGSWFSSIVALCQYLRPRFLVITSFTQVCGAAIIPELLGLPTRVLLSHYIPMDLTSTFACPTAGWGAGTRRGLGCLNTLSWYAGQKLVLERIYLPVAQRLIDKAAAELRLPRPPKLDPRFGCDNMQTIYLYSPSVLPKPGDWGPHLHVVGAATLTSHQGMSGGLADRLARKQSQLPGAAPRRTTAASKAGAELHASAPPVVAVSTDAGEASGPLCRALSIPTAEEMAGEGLAPAAEDDHAAQRIPAHPGPADVEAPAPCPAAGQAWNSALPASLELFLDEAARERLPVVYIGLGSMLRTAFEDAEIDELLHHVRGAVTLLAGSSTPMRAVIHSLPEASLATPRGGAFYVLTHSVDHSALLPRCALVVHHGGAGTMHSVLLAGKPSVIVPCIPLTDQPFWADILVRCRVARGPIVKAKDLTAARLAKAIGKSLENLEELTANAERLSAKMHEENGCVGAADLIEQMSRGEL